MFSNTVDTVSNWPRITKCLGLVHISWSPRSETAIDFAIRNYSRKWPFTVSINSHVLVSMCTLFCVLFSLPFFPESVFSDMMFSFHRKKTTSRFNVELHFKWFHLFQFNQLKAQHWPLNREGFYTQETHQSLLLI